MKTSACKDGTLKDQPNQMGMTQHPCTSCAFAIFANYMPCACYVHRRFVKGSGVQSELC